MATTVSIKFEVPSDGTPEDRAEIAHTLQLIALLIDRNAYDNKTASVFDASGERIGSWKITRTPEGA